jgi:capsular polysaccharide biosynthesis protein
LNEPERTVMWPVGIGDDLPERLWPDGDFPPIEDTPADDPAARLVTLSFIRAALRRRRRLCYLLAAVGLLVGCGLYVSRPPSYQAATTILLKDGPNQNPQVQITSDAALAKSNAVAAAVVRQLGLQQSVATFLTEYSVTQVAYQVLTLTMSAPTSADAVQRANAVAAAFLNVRDQYAQIQEQQLETELNQQLSQARQHLDSISNQISQLSSSGTAPKATLSNLEAQKEAASSSLSQQQSDVTGTILSSRSATQSMIQDSQVINPATPLKHSLVKTGGIYVGGGLIGGLVLGMGIVIIGALVSDRLRRRDDVAYALNAPVRLSIGPLRRGRLPSGGEDRKRDMRRFVDYLGRAVPVGSRGPVGLAVIAVDDPQTVAQAVIALASACASQGRRVFAADLSSGRHMARAMGVTESGVRRVSSDGSTVMLAVPESVEVMPIGPIRSARTSAGLGQPSEAVASAASVADILVTLATLDPAVGADHLNSWATDAIVVVTAGQSNAGTIRSAGEMVRLAGLRIHSAVLIGADDNDESLGAWSSAG